MELSQTTIDTVKVTIPVLNEHGLAITSRMYDILFEKYPETKALFKGAPEDQPEILAAAIAAYATNIDSIDQLHDKVMYIANAHVKSQVKEEHYPMVGDALLTAMQEVLGEAATPEVLEAWKEAYFYLAEILLMNEKQLYAFTRVSKVEPLAGKDK
ncbi:MAG: globin domain-containing protein [Gammaproteobacteria bacterium]|jgi:hemoglobin-like flavoprotein